jgi:RNA polymerase sigma factor (sigma-70 family)
MTLSAHFRRIKKILLRRGQSREEAEDLVHEAFIKMQEYRNKGGEVREPEAFLVRTALRLAINARRDAHRDLYADQNVEEFTQLIDSSPSPDEVLVADECLQLMSEALDAMNRKTRDVFLMHRIDGLSHGEIAARLGISVSAVEKHMISALAAMAGALEQE